MYLWRRGEGEGGGGGGGRHGVTQGKEKHGNLIRPYEISKVSWTKHYSCTCTCTVLPRCFAPGSQFTCVIPGKTGGGGRRQRFSCHGKPVSLSCMVLYHCASSVHPPFSDPFSVNTEPHHCFSLFCTLATRIHVHKLQTANWLERPVGGEGLNSEQGVTARQYGTSTQTARGCTIKDSLTCQTWFSRPGSCLLCFLLFFYCVFLVLLLLHWAFWSF